MRKAYPYLLFVFIGITLAVLAGCAPAAMPTSVPAAATEAIAREGTNLPVATEATAQTEAPAEANPPSAPISPPTLLPMNTQAAGAASQPTQEQSKATSGFEILPTASPPPSQVGPTFASPAPTSPPALPTEPAKGEMHIVQVEWPLQMRMGKSDVARLALVPSSQGYTLVTEYPEHQVVTQTVTVHQTSGYELFAVARLDGVGFDISPSGEQTQYLPPAEGLSWRWSLTPRQPGRQRLSITLILRWVPVAGASSLN